MKIAGDTGQNYKTSLTENHVHRMEDPGLEFGLVKEPTTRATTL